MTLMMLGPAFKWFIFIGAAALSVFASIMMVTRRSPIHSALWLIVAFFSLAVIYLTLGAQFIAVAQVIVYAGAIMMLIIFVIMLIHLEKEMKESGKFSAAKTIGAFVAILFFIEVAAAVISYRLGAERVVPPQGLPTLQGSDVKAIGSLLYGQYLFPFEIASILLLVGIVGAVVLAKRVKG